ncbi:MAG: acyl-CoA thioesterase II [Bacteroidetes bacterium]|nr:MAG: acyl-CoA thioesterase II [Bacteroidota bacterium]
MKPISALLNILELDQVKEGLFRGVSKDIGSPSVFGGQVLSQALYAATRTVDPARLVHSLHGYFILAGDMSIPIDYEVDIIRDGRSFTTRRVVARQHGKAIFIMAASFQIEEEGMDHQVEMLNVPPPESLRSLIEWARDLPDSVPIKRFGLFAEDSPIDVRPVENINPVSPARRPPFRHVWFRANGDLAEASQSAHRYILAYASDFNLLITALLPHGISLFTPGLQIASLDHALWFHRPFRADEWLLYALDSPSASGARGFTRGSVFNREGRLVASVAQEGLMRMRK